jgi:hypothetical protein
LAAREDARFPPHTIGLEPMASRVTECGSAPKFVSFVECPYCDGENVVPESRNGLPLLASPDYEFACKHCQCLFLLSESKLGVQHRPKLSGAA